MFSDSFKTLLLLNAQTDKVLQEQVGDTFKRADQRKPPEEARAMSVRSEQLSVALGKVIKQRRVQLSLSQESFAEKAGLHRTYISDIERGQRNISLYTLDRIALALDMTLSELVILTDSVK